LDAQATDASGPCAGNIPYVYFAVGGEELSDAADGPDIFGVPDGEQFTPYGVDFSRRNNDGQSLETVYRSVSPSPSATPTPSPSPTPSASPTPTASPTETPTEEPGFSSSNGVGKGGLIDKGKITDGGAGSVKAETAQNTQASLAAPAEIVFYLRDVTLLDAQGNRVNKLVEGGTVSDVYVTKDAIADDAKLFAAQYEAGRLARMALLDVAETGAYTLDWTLENITNASEIKIFLWDSDGNIKPLSSSLDADAAYTLNVSAKEGETLTLPIYGATGATSFRIQFDPAFFTAAGANGANFVVVSAANAELHALKTGATKVSVFELESN
jgi:hypothetical protein